MIRSAPTDWLEQPAGTCHTAESRTARLAEFDSYLHAECFSTVGCEKLALHEK
jgi:hypothetical protein